MTTSKQKLHRLVDELPDRATPAAHRYLELLRDHGDDPVLRAFREASEDEDEPLTVEDLAALEEAEQDERAGRVVSHKEARRVLLGDS